MPRLVTKEYSELLHYTTAGGLTGILSSGALWASHASFLNDSKEITRFFDARLPTLAGDAIREFITKNLADPSVSSKIESEGGVDAVVQKAVEFATRPIRAATLKFNQPFIFSMSGARTGRVAKSGQLSQWRGYGGDGGYAIVLDSEKFDQLLKQEGQTRHYQFAQWGDVFYYGAEADQQPSSEEVGQYEETVRKGGVALAQGQHPETVDGLYDAVTSLACLFKHWGFVEEQEVRVVAIPAAIDVAAAAAAAGDSRPAPVVKSFLRSGVPVPYLELFATADKSEIRSRLPIKRVIVGPHRDKVRRAHAVEHLLRSNGYESEVVCSEIPYAGT
jgi:Protein of unknown function (DUF2971)